MLVPEGVQRVGIERQFPGHETDLYHRADSIAEQAVVDLVHISKVVNRLAMFVLVVNAIFIVQDGVETNIPEIGHCFYRAKVFAVALP